MTTDSIFVQTLDKKRGRPRSAMMNYVAEVYPKLTSRQSRYNKWNQTKTLRLAYSLGLVDAEARDIATGKRVATKLATIGQLFGDEIESAGVGEWLRRDWTEIVKLSTKDVIAWARLIKFERAAQERKP